MWISIITVTAAVSYFASTLLPIRGIHDRGIGGALFRTHSDAIALTFDDGPDPERTPVILDLLAEAGITANFFLLGERAARHPDIVRRIDREGHVLGNHSWSHPFLPGLASKRIEEELVRCQETLSDITGQVPRIVRPPYGSRDFRFYRIAKKLGLVPVLWSISGRDWTGIGAKQVLQRIQYAKGGDIVLLHDGNASAVGTIPAVRGLLAVLPQGLKLAPL